MACYPRERAAVIPLPIYLIAHLHSETRRPLAYYGGSIKGSVLEWREAQMWLRAEDAKKVRDALGAGVVLRVYDADRELRPGGLPIE